MDLIIKILHAAVKKNWPIALRIFLIGLLCAIAYPILTVLAGINGNALSPAIIKVVLALACVVTSAAILWQWQWMWNTLPQWWRSGIPLLGVAAIMLLCGAIPPVRSLGVGLGMIMSSMGLFIVAAYAFMTRFLYAALIEAPTSAETDVADAELPAKAVLRTILAILAWEWFGAWYLTTFSPQITMTTGLFAFFSLGIVVLTSYSLGYKGETGQKILLYGAITALILLSLILLDRMIQQGDVSNFLTSGYFGSELKRMGISKSTIGVVGWIAILLFIDLTGTAIAWATQKMFIRHLTFAMVIALGAYLMGNWIVAEEFSMKKSIETLTAFLAPNVRNLSKDVMLALTLGGIAGSVVCTAGIVTGIKKQVKAKTPHTFIKSNRKQFCHKRNSTISQNIFFY
ncbi:MAG: hypothetical protein AAB968_04830 [Patescibacteria group bacterium]